MHVKAQNGLHVPREGLTNRYYQHSAIGEDKHRLYDLDEEPFIECERQVREYPENRCNF